MNPNDASVICGLRNALEEILVYVVAQPEEVLNLDDNYQKALSIIKSFAEFSAGDFQIVREQGISTDRESNYGRSQQAGLSSGFGGGKFSRNEGAGSGGFSSGGYRGGFNSGFQQRGNFGSSGGFNRGGFNNRRGFGHGR